MSRSDMASGKTLSLIGGEFMKWEYCLIEYALTHGRPTDKLNELGEQGWEAVAIDAASVSCSHLIIMKRPKSK
jgi:hypothetical protein